MIFWLWVLLDKHSWFIKSGIRAGDLLDLDISTVSTFETYAESHAWSLDFGYFLIVWIQNFLDLEIHKNANTIICVPSKNHYSAFTFREVSSIFIFQKKMKKSHSVTNMLCVYINKIKTIFLFKFKFLTNLFSKLQVYK